LFCFFLAFTVAIASGFDLLQCPGYNPYTNTGLCDLDQRVRAGFFIDIFVNEVGTGQITTSAAFNSPLVGVITPGKDFYAFLVLSELTTAADPGPGGHPTPFFPLLNPPGLVAGDLFIGPGFDVIRFNPALSGGGLFFYSQAGGGKLADTGLPGGALPTTATITLGPSFRSICLSSSILTVLQNRLHLHTRTGTTRLCCWCSRSCYISFCSNDGHRVGTKERRPETIYSSLRGVHTPKTRDDMEKRGGTCARQRHKHILKD
jgi:hypothetical protein